MIRAAGLTVCFAWGCTCRCWLSVVGADEYGGWHGLQLVMQGSFSCYKISSGGCCPGVMTKAG